MTSRVKKENFNSKLSLVTKSGRIVFGIRSTLNSVRRGEAKIIVIASNCPPVNKSEIEYYALLAKIPVHHYVGNNLELGTACGKLFNVTSCAVISVGDSDILNTLTGGVNREVVCFEMRKNRINLTVCESVDEMATKVANRIRVLLSERTENGKKTSICFPSGETPKPIYLKLKKMAENGLSFKNLIVFSPGNFYPIKKEDPSSSFSYLQRHFLQYVDVEEGNIHIVNGDLPVKDYDTHCLEYEKIIDLSGGINLTILGIGKTGHIAFNEPGSGLNDFTRVVPLHVQTRKDNQKNFGGKIENVPKFAISMGIGTIVKKSEEIIVIATGYHKNKIVEKTLEFVPKTSLLHPPPACFLRHHDNCRFYTDRTAASRTKVVRCPWTVSEGTSALTFKWTLGDSRNTVTQAVVWLSRFTSTPILALSTQDFHDNGLSSLCYFYNDEMEGVCDTVYHQLLSRIHREQTNSLLPVEKGRRVLVFAPHPDDEVISMGGLISTLSLKHQNKEVHIAYMTSGSRGIGKNDLKRHLRFTFSALPIMGINGSLEAVEKVHDELENNRDYEIDSPFIQNLKKNIRVAEAVNGLETLGLEQRNAHFLDLPFYRTGKDKKRVPGLEDRDLIVECMKKVQPTDVVVCFDLEDPHGTHSLCYFVSKDAVEMYEKLTQKKVKRYLYKGAWQEFDTYQCDIFIPLTKKLMDLKIDSIFQHGSQKDKPMFPGDDARQFHERAKERNLKTAKILKDLGLPGFYACEGLKIVDEFPNAVII